MTREWTGDYIIESAAFGNRMYNKKDIRDQDRQKAETGLIYIESR